jgi:hypothetical protein
MSRRYESMIKLKNPMILDMVHSYLKEHKFDGLFNCDGCACLTDDLAPCGEISEDCVAGYRHNYPDHHCPCGEGCSWHIESFPAKDKCRCETERWVTVDENGSEKRSDFVIDIGTCSNGCCEELKCKLCGKNLWRSKTNWKRPD